MLKNLGSLVRRACTTANTSTDAVDDLVSQIGPEDMALIIVFVSPKFDYTRVARALNKAYPETPIVGCSTAGEIGDTGYMEGTIVAVGLPQESFYAATTIIDNLADLKFRAIAGQVLELRRNTLHHKPDWAHEFAMLFVDGLSLKEDSLVSAIMPALGNIQLFGGSAGDGMSFQKTQVIASGEVLSNAAVLVLVRTKCPVHVFRFDNFVPTDIRMVVTDADPAERMVKEINAEPAAREYARLVGKDPDQLSPFIFAAHPVVVRVGGQHHVRAIQQVVETGHLRFFSEINEGMVLTVARGQDMASHLEHALSGLSTGQKPASIIACDCILRRLDAEQQQATRAVSQTLSDHGVVGFSTYGEQHNSLHVNQTFTGVAIYPPDVS